MAAISGLRPTLSLVVCLISVQASGAVDPVPTAWGQEVSEAVVHAEYRLAPVADGSWSAPNRAHDFRAKIGPAGLEVTPRLHRADALGGTWRLELSLSTLGRGKQRTEIGPTPVEQHSDRVVLRRERLHEWYANDERGLEHGFIVESRIEPADSDSPLTLELTLGGDLGAYLSDNAREVLFRDGTGRAVLRYGSLFVQDATGAEIASRFDLSGRSLLIRVEDRNAVYPLSIDPLMTSPSWTAESDQANAQFGTSVATAGDVNGDGYSDIIVGAPLFDNGQADEGRAYLFLGSPSGLATTPAWTFESDQAGAGFGTSVAPGGDVNGDGFGDVIVGAPRYDNGQTDEGRAYVFLGSPSGLSTTPAWTTESNQAGAQLGTAVAPAGDVNGDGFDEVIVGAPFFDNGQTDEGRASVFLGSPSGLAATPAWTAESNQANAQFGTSVATAGDVDGNGFADVIVGAFAYDNGQTDEGRVYAFLGTASGLATTAAWTVESNQAGAEFGRAVAPAGDVNGDGYSDVIVGSHLYDNGENNEGRAFLYLGSSSGLATTAAWTAESDQATSDFGLSVATAGDVNGDGYADVIVGSPLFKNGQRDEGVSYLYMGSAAGLSTTPVWTGENNQMSASFGFSVAAAGDVDGDGFGDVIVGSNMYENGQNAEGRAYVFLGSAGGPATVPGWTVESNQDGALFGQSVATAGDVNGDGYSDVLVSAPQFDGGQTNEGRAFVFLGSPTGLTTSPAWTAESDQADAQFGYSVSSAGDTNGDGYGDVIVGAYLYDNGQSNEGRAYVFLGSASGLSPTPVWTVESNQVGAQFGSSVAGAGDVNGDGYGDVIVGAFSYDNGQADEGRAFVYLGSASGPESTAAWTAESNQAGAAFGAPVASAGDVNGDGYSDVIVGAWLYGVFGRAYVFMGSSSGLSSTPAWIGEGDQADELFGFPVTSAGDVNGDGFSDVLVGATSYDAQNIDEGRALLYLGSASGLSSTPAWSAVGDQSGAAFGYVRARGGDVNGDGFSDVVIGAPYYDNGQLNEGRAYLYLGSGSGLAGQPAWFVEGDQSGVLTGYAAGTAGDVNGDGFGDLIVSSYQWDNGQTNAGKASVFYGNGGVGVSRAPRQARVNATAPIDLLGQSDSESSVRLKALGRTPAGRGKLRLESEVKSLGAPFNGSATQRSGVQDSGLPGGSGSSTSFDFVANGLNFGTPYRWRMRTLSGSPFFPHSPWLTMPYNGRSETDFRTPTSCHDADHDGYGSPGHVQCPAGSATDCNDANPAVHPGVAELCDNIDNNCDGTVDGFTTSCGIGPCAAQGSCVAGVNSCTPGAPAPEVCDNIDNNCDGTVDGFTTSCGIGACAAQGSCIAGVNNCTPGAPSPEVCDGVDNNCDGANDNVPPPSGSLVLSVTRDSLSWTADASSAGYDVVRGNLAVLRSSGGDFTVATSACLANDRSETFLDDPVSPATGEGFWLLLRGNTSGCTGGNGTYDTGAASQAGPRDGEIAASTGACP